MSGDPADLAAGEKPPPRGVLATAGLTGEGTAPVGCTASVQLSDLQSSERVVR